MKQLLNWFGIKKSWNFIVWDVSCRKKSWYWCTKFSLCISPLVCYLSKVEFRAIFGSIIHLLILIFINNNELMGRWGAHFFLQQCLLLRSGFNIKMLINTANAGNKHGLLNAPVPSLLIVWILPSFCFKQNLNKITRLTVRSDRVFFL